MNLPENVAVAFRFAQGLWPHDPAAGSEATALAWSSAIADYSVDELCPVLERQAREHAKMPPLVVLIEDLRNQRRKAAAAAIPLLTSPKPIPHAAVPPSMNPYREKLRDDLRRYHRRQGTGKIDKATLAEIEARVNEVGEHEQKALAYIEAHPDADWGPGVPRARRGVDRSQPRRPAAGAARGRRKSASPSSLKPTRLPNGQRRGGRRRLSSGRDWQLRSERSPTRCAPRCASW